MAARYTLIVFTLNILLRWAANRAIERLLAGHGCKGAVHKMPKKNFSIPTLYVLRVEGAMACVTSLASCRSTVLQGREGPGLDCEAAWLCTKPICLL